MNKTGDVIPTPYWPPRHRRRSKVLDARRGGRYAGLRGGCWCACRLCTAVLGGGGKEERRGETGVPSSPFADCLADCLAGSSGVEREGGHEEGDVLLSDLEGR